MSHIDNLRRALASAQELSELIDNLTAGDDGIDLLYEDTSAIVAALTTRLHQAEAAALTQARNAARFDTLSAP